MLNFIIELHWSVFRHQMTSLLHFPFNTFVCKRQVSLLFSPVTTCFSLALLHSYSLSVSLVLSCSCVFQKLGSCSFILRILTLANSCIVPGVKQQLGKSCFCHQSIVQTKASSDVYRNM